MSIIQKIERISNRKTLILGLVITVITLTPMQLILSQILVLTSGRLIMDLRISYTVDDVGILLTMMGESGRQLYSQIQILDSFFPIGMLLVMLNVIVNLTSRVFPEESPFRSVFLIPFFVTVFDYLENIHNATQVAAYPNLSPAVIARASLMSSFKVAFIILTIGVILILAVMVIVKNRRE